MVNCGIKLCRNYSAKKVPGITFFNFPKDPELKRKWVEAINREASWFPTKYTHVCSIHFEESSYDVTSAGIRRLHNNAVPTKHLYLQQEPAIQPETSQQNTLLDTPLKRKMSVEINRLKHVIINQKHKIKRLNNTARRSKVKIANLEKLIQTLKQKNLVTDCESSVLNNLNVEVKD